MRSPIQPSLEDRLSAAEAHAANIRAKLEHLLAHPRPNPKQPPSTSTTPHNQPHPSRHVTHNASSSSTKLKPAPSPPPPPLPPTHPICSPAPRAQTARPNPPSAPPPRAPAVPEASGSQMAPSRIESKLDALHTVMASALSLLQSQRTAGCAPGAGSAPFIPPPPPPMRKMDGEEGGKPEPYVDAREAMLKELKERIRHRAKVAEGGG